MHRVGKLGTGWKALGAALIGIGAAALIATHAFAGGSSLTVGNVTLLPGEDAQLQLKLSDPGSPGLGAWDVEVDYNPAHVSAVSCTAGPGSVCNVNFGPSTIKVVGAAGMGLRGDTVLATLRFRCDSEGSSALALTPIEVADATQTAPQPVDVDVHHGSINCLAPEPPPSDLRGDANCDGVVNSVDALIVLQYVARLRNSVPCPDLADYDQNGHITSVDAALILQRDAGLI